MTLFPLSIVNLDLTASAAGNVEERTASRAMDDSKGCGDGHAGDRAFELAVCGEEMSFWSCDSFCSGITRRSPLSLGVREPLADVFGRVSKRAIKGLTGVGLGIRGEASEVLPYAEFTKAVDSVEWPCAFL